MYGLAPNACKRMLEVHPRGRWGRQSMHEAIQPNGEIPVMRAPLVIAAFWGWSDSSGTAMGASRYLRDVWGATEIASVDADRFYDLTVARPHIRRENGEPIVRWPGTRFHFATPPGSERDVVVLAGREPGLRWKEYADALADFMQTVGAKHFLALGSRPTEVPHTRPAPIQLGDADPYFEQLFGRTSEPSSYEGPTGIQTVLMLHLRSLGYSTARLTALVPGYLNVGPSPRAVMSLAEELDRALGSHTPLQLLEDEIAPFERRVETVTGQMDDPGMMHTQLQQLEDKYDSDAAEAVELPSSSELLEGIEALLRRSRTEDGNEPSAR